MDSGINTDINIKDSRLAFYLSAWGLNDQQLLTQTFTSQIYTVIWKSETCVLKLLSPTETEEQRGAEALRYFNGHGAVRLLQSDAHAQLLEFAAGDELVTLVDQGQDDKATRIIAEVLQELHSFQKYLPQKGLFRLEDWFRALFQKAKIDAQAGQNTIYVRCARVTEQLLANQRDIRVLHGDIHHRNIRQSPRGWLAFDPKGLIGERTYDCANTLCNPVRPELVHNETRLLTQAGILADSLSIDLQRVLAFTYAYACLNASQWVSLKSGQEIIDWSLKVAQIIEPHIII